MRWMDRTGEARPRRGREGSRGERPGSSSIVRARTGAVVGAAARPQPQPVRGFGARYPRVLALSFSFVASREEKKIESHSNAFHVYTAPTTAPPLARTAYVCDTGIENPTLRVELQRSGRTSGLGSRTDRAPHTILGPRGAEQTAARACVRITCGTGRTATGASITVPHESRSMVPVAPYTGARCHPHRAGVAASRRYRGATPTAEAAASWASGAGTSSLRTEPPRKRVRGPVGRCHRLAAPATREPASTNRRVRVRERTRSARAQAVRSGGSVRGGGSLRGAGRERAGAAYPVLGITHAACLCVP